FLQFIAGPCVTVALDCSAYLRFCYTGLAETRYERGDLGRLHRVPAARTPFAARDLAARCFIRSIHSADGVGAVGLFHYAASPSGSASPPSASRMRSTREDTRLISVSASAGVHIRGFLT